MAVTLKEIMEAANHDSRHRGFRSVGIYHLLWAVRELAPETFDSWMKNYQIEKEPFVKMLENILMPRRAGGGVPRDRIDADLKEEAVTRASSLAEENGESPEARHLGLVFKDLSEDPVVSICERFCLNFSKPD
jgi:hypothetical protein